jgi:hypothetical protein
LLAVGTTGCGRAPDAAQTQDGSEPGAKPSAAQVVTAAVTIDDTPREPATVEEAARLLDLRTFPVLDDPKFIGKPTLGRLSYDAKGETKAALDFQRKHLTERGWKELPDSQFKDAYAQSNFTRDGFVVMVSVYETSDKPGTVNVSFQNYGNVRPGKLPVAAEAKPEYVGPYGAGYVTTAKVAEIAEACRKLLVEKGWQPYGAHSHEDKIATMNSQEFKRNAIALHVTVSTHENRPGQTMIQYNTHVLSTDLPAPATADAKTLRYDDQNGTLRFDTTDKADDVAAFYRDTLAKQNWKPTIDRLTDMSMVFRNPAKAMIILDVKAVKDVTRVKVQYFTAKFVEELDRASEAEKQKPAKQPDQPKPKLALPLPLPEGAKNIERVKDTVVEFKLRPGSSKALVEFYRKHFKAAGWKEEKGVTEAQAGSVSFAKGTTTSVSINYTDIGFGQDCEVKVWSFGIILEVPKEGKKE